jgi:ER lumen protein retaining receptor
MNIFRFFGDLSHLVSILTLIYTMQERRSSAGISFKSQCLYTVVFVSRYLGIPCPYSPWNFRHVIQSANGGGEDLFWSYVSLYNTVMKVFFISSSLYILYLMKHPFRPTFDPNIDTFKIEFLVIGAFAAAMVFNYEYSFSEVSTLVPALLSPPLLNLQFRRRC